MTDTTASTVDRIRALNDAFRRTFIGGAVMITTGVEAMPAEQRKSLLQKVRAFDAFTDDNDPHREHDFGAVDEGGVRYFWKIDCYERATEFGSPDPVSSPRGRASRGTALEEHRPFPGAKSPRSTTDGDAKARRCPSPEQPN
jgi:hypothetical protein